MKFFTLDLWMGLQEPKGARLPDWNAAHAAYAEHLCRIKGRLPAAVCEFADRASLHDSHLREIELRIQQGFARLALDGDDGAGGLRQHNLEYRSLSAFHSHSDPAKSLMGPGGYGDLGYDELDLTDEGACVHRILFSTGVELALEFGDLRWHYIDG